MLRDIFSFLLHHLVFAMMLSIGLMVRHRDLIEVVKRPVFYLRSVAVMELGVPLLAMGVVALFSLSDKANILILLMAVCPGAPFIPFGAREKGGTHSVVGLNLLLLVSLLAPLTVPLWVMMLNRFYPYHLDVAPLEVFTIVAKNIVGPLLLGLLIQRFTRVADVIGRVAHYFFLVALVVVLVAAVVLGAKTFLEVQPIAFLAVFVMATGSALLGYWAASPRPEERKAVSMAAALGNPSLALAVVAATFPGFHAAAMIAAYLLFRRLSLVPIEKWIQRKKPVVFRLPEQTAGRGA